MDNFLYLLEMMNNVPGKTQENMDSFLLVAAPGTAEL
jgi:hypothetical protein